MTPPKLRTRIRNGALAMLAVALSLGVLACRRCISWAVRFARRFIATTSVSRRPST